MDYGFRRPKEKWEASDGAVYLLRELAQVGYMTWSRGLCCPPWGISHYAYWHGGLDNAFHALMIFVELIAHV